MKTQTFRANNERQIVAHQQAADFGASYFNPLIGQSAGMTCSRIEPVMEMLCGLLGRGAFSEDESPGLKLVIQTAWAAVQYEKEVFSKESESQS